MGDHRERDGCNRVGIRGMCQFVVEQLDESLCAGSKWNNSNG